MSLAGVGDAWARAVSGIMHKVISAAISIVNVLFFILITNLLSGGFFLLLVFYHDKA